MANGEGALAANKPAKNAGVLSSSSVQFRRDFARGKRTTRRTGKRHQTQNRLARMIGPGDLVPKACRASFGAHASRARHKKKLVRALNRLSQRNRRRFNASSLPGAEKSKFFWPAQKWVGDKCRLHTNAFVILLTKPKKYFCLLVACCMLPNFCGG